MLCADTEQVKSNKSKIKFRIFINCTGSIYNLKNNLLFLIKKIKNTLIKFLFTFSLTIIICSNGVYSQPKPRFDSLITTGIRQIYNIKFDSAEATFKRMSELYSGHPAGHFFPAMIDWWRIMLDLQVEEYDEEFIEKLDGTIDFCDDILDDDPDNVDALFFKGGALGFRGRLYAVREDFFNAALDGKEALPLVYKAYELEPENKDVELGFGIYNYYAEVIPREYPFVKPFMIFFPGGDRIKGLKQLEDVAQNGRYAKIESRYFLMMLYYKYEENYGKALEYNRLLLGEFPDNPTFHRYEGRIYAKQGDWKTAADKFQNVFDKCVKGFPGYNKKTRREAAYYVGNWYKLDCQFDSAKKYLKISESLSKELDVEKQTGFLANSVLFLGMILDTEGYRKLAIEKYKEVLEIEDYHKSHDLAEKYLKTPCKLEKLNFGR